MKNKNRTEHKLTFTFRFSELGFRANEIDEIDFERDMSFAFQRGNEKGGDELRFSEWERER
jgi:hypothetical protein